MVARSGTMRRGCEGSRTHVGMSTFDTGKHPRVPEGQPGGGQFATKTAAGPDSSVTLQGVPAGTEPVTGKDGVTRWVNGAGQLDRGDGPAVLYPEGPVEFWSGGVRQWRNGGDADQFTDEAAEALTERIASGKGTRKDRARGDLISVRRVAEKIRARYPEAETVDLWEYGDDGERYVDVQGVFDADGNHVVNLGDDTERDALNDDLWPDIANINPRNDGWFTTCTSVNERRGMFTLHVETAGLVDGEDVKQGWFNPSRHGGPEW